MAKNDIKTKKRITPIIVDEMSSEKAFIPVFKEKVEVKGSVPDGHMRVIVLKECDGQTGTYLPGDIVDLPERRFKSMRLRGLVDQYFGKDLPNRKR